MIDPAEKMRLVELVEYDSSWTHVFFDAADEIKTVLGDNCLEVHHIGSTAIPGIYAKPIIDILPVVKDIHAVDLLNHKFEALGYVCQGEYGISGRRFYWKTKERRTHHIHLFEQNSPEIVRHVAFKNFMLAYKEYARAYSLIKRNLAKVFFNDIENYVNGKASFVQMIDYKTSSARANQLEAQDDIVIYSYNPAWEKLATAEIESVKEVASLPFISMDHIGSTAVPNLSGKPIIDIFIVIQSIKEAGQWIKPLESMGYKFWDKNPDQSHLRFFKGMPPFGTRRTHHIHLMDESNPTREHRILFRDILRTDEKIRLQYESLKQALSQSFQSDREAYTEGKSQCIEKILRAYGYAKPVKR